MRKAHFADDASPGRRSEDAGGAGGWLCDLNQV